MKDGSDRLLFWAYVALAVLMAAVLLPLFAAACFLTIGEAVSAWQQAF